MARYGRSDVVGSYVVYDPTGRDMASCMEVGENTPGYMPEDDDPATFEDYADAVAYLNERCKEYEDDADGNYRVEYGYASAGNYAAAMVWDDDKTHDLGCWISVELFEDES